MSKRDLRHNLMESQILSKMILADNSFRKPEIQVDISRKRLLLGLIDPQRSNLTGPNLLIWSHHPLPPTAVRQHGSYIEQVMIRRGSRLGLNG